MTAEDRTQVADTAHLVEIKRYMAVCHECGWASGEFWSPSEATQAFSAHLRGNHVGVLPRSNVCDQASAHAYDMLR
ncbi:MAG TPA: hypothetical protein VFP61_11775 [Acidimicrobiales bacterium]|nr:hypothetical protein [Acidimicrobiales bacterium]